MFCNAKNRIDYKPKGNLDHYYNYGIKFRGGYNIMMQFQNCILNFSALLIMNQLRCSKFRGN